MRFAVHFLVLASALFSPAGFAVRIRDIEAWLADEKAPIRTLEQLLEKLPASYRQNYVSLFHSRSLQPATPKSPRVIFFGKDAKLLLAFNGDPNLPGYSNLEMIEYDDSKGSFSFREVKFDPAAKQKPVLDKNPLSCAACHGVNPRPRWDSYFFWPGVYGSEDDHLTFHPQVLKGPSVEKRWAEAFEKKRAEQDASGNGRYGSLVLGGGGYSGDSSRPNAAMSEKVHTLNLRAITHELKRDPILHPLRFAILAIFLTGEGKKLGAFFAPELERELNELLAELADDVHRVNRRALEAKHARNRQLIGTDPVARAHGYNSPSRYYNEHTAALRFLVEGIGNHEVINWGLEFQPRSYEFDINGDIGDLENPLREFFLVGTEKEMLEKIDYHGGLAELIRRHKDAFPINEANTAIVKKAIAKLRARLKEPTPSVPFGRCVTCHAPGNANGARVIAFGDLGKLFHELAADKALAKDILERTAPIPPVGKRGMPLDGTLLPRERADIVDFVNRTAEK